MLQRRSDRIDFGFFSGPITLSQLDFFVYWGFENKKESCLMLSSNLCGIVAQHDHLDWIYHLSNFGMVSKSTA